MRKIAIIVVLGVISIGLGTAYFYWQQATSLPEWYSDNTTNTAPTISSSDANPEPVSSPRSAHDIATQIQAAPPGAIQATLSAAEIDNLILAGLTPKQAGAASLPSAVKAIKTKIQPQQIQTGAVVDLGALAKMPPSNRTAQLQKILQLVPQLQGRQVYVGVSGQLTVKNQQLQLANDSKLQIGKVEFGLDEAAQQLGLSRAQLAQQLTSYLQLPQLNVQQIELTNQGAIITGTKK